MSQSYMKQVCSLTLTSIILHHLKLLPIFIPVIKTLSSAGTLPHHHELMLQYLTYKHDNCEKTRPKV